MKARNFLIIGESLNFFDFIVTGYLVFIRHCYELNPIVRFINRFGFRGFVIAKVFCALLIVALYYLLRIKKRRRNDS